MKNNKYNKLKEALKPLIRKQLDETYIVIIPIGAKSLNEGISMNGFSVDKRNDSRGKTPTYFNLNEDDKDPIVIEDFEDKGGIIVFSTVVNAVKISDNELINWLKAKIETIKNKLNLNKKINNILRKHEDVYGVTIGNFVKGRYKSQDSTLYDENSLSIEIIGITTDVLNRIAKDITIEFKQESVLVKNYETNKIYLVK